MIKVLCYVYTKHWTPIQEYAECGESVFSTAFTHYPILANISTNGKRLDVKYSLIFQAFSLQPCPDI